MTRLLPSLFARGCDRRVLHLASSHHADRRPGQCRPRTARPGSASTATSSCRATCCQQPSGTTQCVPLLVTANKPPAGLQRRLLRRRIHRRQAQGALGRVQGGCRLLQADQRPDAALAAAEQGACDPRHGPGRSGRQDRPRRQRGPAATSASPASSPRRPTRSRWRRPTAAPASWSSPCRAIRSSG